MELSERINALVKYSGLSIPKFAKAIGTQTPQAIRDLISGKTKTLSKDIYDKILSYNHNIRPAWLLAGDGEMLISYEKKREPSQNSVGRMIPFYDVETTGGYDGLVSGSDEGELVGYVQPGGWFDGRETAAIRHVGDSMIEYPSGCILAVRAVTDTRLLVPGHNYVFETSEYRVTKRYQRGSSPDTIALYSTNTEKYEDGRLVYEPFEIHVSDVRRVFSVLGYIVNQTGEFRLIKP